MIKDKYFRVCLVVTIVLLLAIFASCNNKVKTKTEVINSNISIITIDSCEYVQYYNFNWHSYALVHKGNCKFCAERSKK